MPRSVFGGVALAAALSVCSAAMGQQVDTVLARDGLTAAGYTADLAKCGEIASSAASARPEVSTLSAVPYPYQGTLAGAAGGAIASVLLTAMDQAQAKKLGAYQCMKNSGYSEVRPQIPDIAAYETLPNDAKKAAWLETYVGSGKYPLAVAATPTLPPGQYLPYTVGAVRIVPETVQTRSLSGGTGVILEADAGFKKTAVLSTPFSVQPPDGPFGPSKNPTRYSASPGAIFYEVDDLDISPILTKKYHTAWCGGVTQTGGKDSGSPLCLIVENGSYYIGNINELLTIYNTSGFQFLKPSSKWLPVTNSYGGVFAWMNTFAMPRSGFTTPFTTPLLNFSPDATPAPPGFRIHMDIQVKGRDAYLGAFAVNKADGDGPGALFWRGSVTFDQKGEARLPFWDKVLVLSTTGAGNTGVSARLDPGGDGRGWVP